MNVQWGKRDGARETLEALGFTGYEAECLVTLVQQPEATATTISDQSDLPRSRVYDVADALVERGLVEVCDGEPKRYRAIPAARIVEALTEEYESQIDRVERHLTALESTENGDTDECSVWSLSGRAAVLDRFCEIVDETEQELSLLVTDRSLTTECLERLQSAIDRGVETTVLTRAGDDTAASWLRSRLSGVQFREAPPVWKSMSGDSDLACLLLTDRNAALAVTREASASAANPDYTGTLSTGDKCGFVMTLEQTLEPENVLRADD